MKIIFVTPEFLEKNKPSTGLPIYLYRVSKAMQEMGHEAIIVTGGTKREYTHYDGIRVYRYNTKLSFETGYLPLDYSRRVIRTGRILNKGVSEICKKEKVDLIQFASVQAPGVLYRGKVPAILRLSSYARKYFGSYQTYDRISVEVMAFWERLAARKMKGIIGPSYVNGNAYAQDIKRDVTIIETPFLMDNILLDSKIYDKKLNGKRYLFFFGTFNEDKGVGVIADAIYQILDAHPEICFVLAGGGANTDRGKRLCQRVRMNAKEHRDRVMILGNLEHKHLYPVIQRAECIVLPSIMENFSNACVEAMYFGKIVIGTDGASYEQLITDGYSGFLAKPGSATSLYHAVNRALAVTGDEKEKMEEHAKQRIKQLRPEITVKSLLDYYEKILNGE